MQSVKDASHRFVYAAIGLFAVITLGLGLSSLGAGAAQVAERSVELSNTSKAAQGVNYRVTFTPVEAAQAFVLEFCENSPVIGVACTAPAGLDASEAVIGQSTPGFTKVSSTANRIVVSNALAANTQAQVDIQEMVNPDDAGAMYIRIITFDTVVSASDSTFTSHSGKVDEGGAVVAITDTIGVSGTVLESLTFCASQSAIPDDCQTIETPTLRLGEPTGDTVALQPGVLSEGSIFVQLSTNATSGAVVRLKSTATDCGGLLRAGETDACYIGPALDDDILVANDDAKFGVKTADATDTVGALSATGVLKPATGSFYNNDTFALNFIENNVTGVTSTFGDPFIDTDGKPATHKNMKLTFGASVNNDTPAGVYSTDISMIAVGTF